MRYITIPSPITLVVRGEGPQGPQEPKEFMELLRAWLNHEDFGKGAGPLRSSVKIEKAFDGKSAGEEIAIEDVDYDLLLAVVRKQQYTGMARQMLPFLDAVEEAEKKPRAEREKEASP